MILRRVKVEQAVILVGGEGTRLRPLTYKTPKPMVPILGVPFLARTVERLSDAGVLHVIFAAGYMPQAIVDYFGNGSALGIRITYVIEETPLGTAGALKNVEKHITGPFFVFNGDILTSLDLARDDALSRTKARHRRPPPDRGGRSLGIWLRRARFQRRDLRLHRKAAA